MSKSAAKLEKVRADRDRFFSEGKYYEALQLYKTLYSRTVMKKSWEEAQTIVVEGATALLQQKQSNSGLELAISLFDLFAKSKQSCGEEQAKLVLTLCGEFPVPEGNEAKINFLKAAIKWSSSPQTNHNGFPDFHFALARTYRSMSDFASAHQHYLRSGGASGLIDLSQKNTPDSKPHFRNQEYIEDAQSILAWAQEANAPHELDLFVIRSVLQFLCLDDATGANTILKWFKLNRVELATEPLIHFGEFMIEICQPHSTANAPLFDVLRHKYALALTRDPGFDAYLDRIGEIFFGRQAPKGFMESMLSGLTASSSSSSSTNKTNGATTSPTTEEEKSSIPTSSTSSTSTAEPMIISSSTDVD